MTDAATTREANPPQSEDDRANSTAMSCLISGQEGRPATAAELYAEAQDLVLTVASFGAGIDRMDRERLRTAARNLMQARAMDARESRT